MSSDTPERYVSTAEAAAFLGFSPKTLRKWRTLRRGPPFSRINGRTIAYRVADLSAYMEAHRQAHEG